MEKRNIFEEAGAGKGPKKAAPLPKTSNEDLQAALKRAHQAHDELQKNLEKLYQKSGLSPKQIEQFLDNPDNLTEKLQKLLKEKRDLLKKMSSGPGWEKLEKAKEEPEDKKRKTKTLGKRQRWISM